MRRALKKSIGIVLSMLLLLSLLPMTAFADDEPTYPAIKVGETKTIEPTEDGMVYFLFTPEETGWYSFVSSNEEANGFYGGLERYDNGEYRAMITGYWRYGSDDHMLIQRKLEAGTTYRFGLESDERTGSYNVTLYRPYTYTVRFHAGAGYFTNPDLEDEVREDEFAENASLNNWTHPRSRDNTKTFSGWAYSSGATEVEITGNEKVNSELDLYAVYGKPVTITYDCNGGYTNYYMGQPLEKYEMSGGGAGRWFDDIQAYYSDDSKVFDGWFTEPEGGDPYKQGDHVMDDLTVYAHWVDAIKVTYNANGGFFENSEDPEVYIRYYKPDEAFVSYYIMHSDTDMSFQGWFTDPVGGVRVSSDFTLTDDITVYAHWGKRITVTLNANGGFFEYYEDQPEVLTRNVMAGGHFYLEEPSNADATLIFDGWYDKKTGGEKVVSSDSITASITLYAHWIQGKVVTFDTNGGTFRESEATIRTQTYLSGAILSPYTLTGLDVVNSNPRKVCIGWSRTKNATKPDEDLDQMPVDDLTTLYAVWADGIKITVHAGDGYFQGQYDYETGEWEKLKSVEVYVPVGTKLISLYSYYTGRYGTNGFITAYMDPKTRKDFGYRSLTADGPVIENSYEFTKDTEIYVVWKDFSVITFDAGEGRFTGVASSTPITQATVEIESGVEQPIKNFFHETVRSNDPGKAFIGWSLTGKEEDIVTSIKPTGNMTLYAVYKNGYAITFQTNIDTSYVGWLNGMRFGVYDTNTAIWPEEVPFSKTNFQCTIINGDYILQGISLTEDGKNLINDNWYPTENTTLYLVFTEGCEVLFFASPGTFPSSGDYYLEVPVKKGEAIGKVETPVQEGKVFAGWREYQTQKIIDPTTYVPEEWTEFDAVWEDAGQVFKDVQNPSAWYFETVYKIASTTNANGNPLMSGYSGANAGKFGPADPLTRQDFAIILYRLADEPPVEEMENPFKDTNPKGYYYTCVLWAKANEVIAGYNDGRFGVGDKITREQVATILYRFAKDYMKIDTSEALGKGDLTKFKDGKAISSWAAEALTWATGAGVITGKSNGTMIDARGNAARAEIGAMVLRFIDYINNAQSNTGDMH